MPILMKYFFVKDISLASILTGFGIPPRLSDPVTSEKEVRNGAEVLTRKFWLDISAPEHEELCKKLVSAYGAARNWETYEMDAEHPLYWMKGALENRCTWLEWVHNGVTTMTKIEEGDRTVFIGPRLSQANRNILKKAL